MDSHSFPPSSWQSRVPTRLLDQPSVSRRPNGLSGALPQIPRTRFARPIAEGDGTAQRVEATRRRRWLLAIFGRMMARFYELHERRLSAGRALCTMCHHRIVAWAWHALPGAEVEEIVHERCISHSVWEMVLYYEYLVNSGLTPPDGQHFEHLMPTFS